MTWIKTVNFDDADETLRRLWQQTRDLYPPEYAVAVEGLDESQGGGITQSHSLVPNILFHAMGIPSFQQQEGLAALAERDNVCILTPTLGAFGLFDVSAEIGRALETASFEHARLELNRVASLWHARLEWRAVTNPIVAP